MGFGLLEKALAKTKECLFRPILNLLKEPKEINWTELEERLILADVGLDATQKILARLKQKRNQAPPLQLLKEELIAILKVPSILPSFTTPWVILVVGVNGTGKTTSIAKLAYRYKSEGKEVILAAADTFRAAAIEQLKEWGMKVGAEVIAQRMGADAAAVAYDALEATIARGADVLIVDTAGRFHTKYNLMEELKKIKRVLSKRAPYFPQEILLVMDATTGQNGLLQARSFAEALGVNGIFLTKLDGTAKGGIVVAIAQELKIPVRYIGTGQDLEDIADFDAETFVNILCS